MRQNNKGLQYLKTVENHLPPLPTKVTDSNTIYSYISYLQGLTKNVNMPYVNITLDVGAAMSAYKTIWTFPNKFDNVLPILVGSGGKYKFLLFSNIVTPYYFASFVTTNQETKERIESNFLRILSKATQNI